MLVQSNVGGSAVASVSDSMLTYNANALVQIGAGSVPESLVNNHVRQNTNNTFGTITGVSPL